MRSPEFAEEWLRHWQSWMATDAKLLAVRKCRVRESVG